MRAFCAGRPLFCVVGEGIAGKIWGSDSDRVGDRLQKYLIVFGLFMAYNMRTAEKAFLGVLLQGYKSIFLTQNNAF